MRKAPALRYLVEMVLFLSFVVLYMAPMLSQFAELSLPDHRVVSLIDKALAVPLVRAEIARNAFTHLALVTAYYMALRWMGHSIAAAVNGHAILVPLLIVLNGWLFLVAGNAAFFPHSDYSIVLNWAADERVFYVAGLILSMSFCFSLWTTLRRIHSRSSMLLPIGALACAALLVVLIAPSRQAQATGSASQQNVIIIGIDSLSAAVWEHDHAHLPNLAGLMKNAVRYDRAYTLLGRTFPAWQTILSGTPPASNGALFNLRSLEGVQREGLVTQELHDRGYRTVFAMDERRFNNMDESFGFDYVVGPKAGLLDFAVQAFNDSPLTNLLLQTPLAAQALPYSYLNVAAHPSYDADGFVDAISEKTSGAPKLFLAVHFLSGHFPFSTRHATIDHHHPNKFHAKHVEALSGIDVQVGRLMSSLKAQGHLKDALIILLSDHGEGLGRVEAEITENGKPAKLQAYGHGTNVLSDDANRIVLATIRFRDGKAHGNAAVKNEQVSLLDVRAAVERYVAGAEANILAKTPCIPVETGIRLVSTLDYRSIDNKAVAREGQPFYEIDEQGRMRLREDKMPGLVQSKDVGWRCQDRITYYRHRDKSYYSYRLENGGRSLLETEPDARDVEQIERYRANLVAAARPRPSRVAAK